MHIYTYIQYAQWNIIRIVIINIKLKINLFFKYILTISNKVNIYFVEL